MAPTEVTIKKLFALSYNSCAYRGCETNLSRPEWPKVMADICHIRAQSAGGPRWDPDYTNVHAFENLILMCPTCHRKIDHLELQEWTVELLEMLKAEHEERGLDGEAARWWAIGTPPGEDPDVRLVWLARTALAMATNEAPPPRPGPEPPLSPLAVRQENDIVYLRNPNTVAVEDIVVEPGRKTSPVMIAVRRTPSFPAGHEIEVARMARALGDDADITEVLKVRWSYNGVQHSGEYPLA